MAALAPRRATPLAILRAFFPGPQPPSHLIRCHSHSHRQLLAARRPKSCLGMSQLVDGVLATCNSPMNSRMLARLFRSEATPISLVISTWEQLTLIDAVKVIAKKMVVIALFFGALALAVCVDLLVSSLISSATPFCSFFALVYKNECGAEQMSPRVHCTLNRRWELYISRLRAKMVSCSHLKSLS